MEEIGETLSLRLSESTVKADADEILTLLRQSTARAIADPSTPESKILALDEKYASLGCLSRMLLGFGDQIQRVVDDLKSEALKVEVELIELEMPYTDFSPPVVIQFVHHLEQANQYFDFKERAKLACRHLESTPCPIKVSDFLQLNQQLLSEFDQIREPQIRQALNAIFWELHNEQRGKKDIDPMKEDSALADLIYNLVFETRVKGYVMDEDPVAELEKLFKFRPHLYGNYFVSQQLPVECTERLKQEARNKYSHLVSIMMAKYKETSSKLDEFACFTTSARNIDAFHSKLMVTSKCYRRIDC